MNHIFQHIIFVITVISSSLALVPLCTAQEQDSEQEPFVDGQDDYGETEEGMLPENVPQVFETFTIEQGFEDGFIPVAEEVELEEGDEELPDYEYEDDSNGTFEISTRGEDEISLPNPVYEISEIVVTGNTQTSRERIISMMSITEGSQVTLNELDEIRFQLAVSGAFKSVEMTLVPDKTHQKMGIHLDVVENSKIQINNYWLGTSEKSPFWMGLDVTWIAPFSLPHRMRFAFGAMTTNDYTLNLTYLVPSVSKYSLSLFATVHSTHGHEGLFGNLFIPDSSVNQSDSQYFHLGDLTYHSNGVTFGMGYSPAENVRLMLRLHYSHIHKETTDSRLDSPTHGYLAGTESDLPTISAIASFDNRTGRDLPVSGHFVSGGVTGTFKTAMSDYQYIRASLFHQSNFEVHPQHILRLQTFAGLIYGVSPFFERFFYNDFYTLAPSRFYNLNPSDSGALDLFGTGASSLSYEDFLVNLSLIYAWQPIRQLFELFVTVSATYADSFKKKELAIGIQPNRERSRFPVDMSFNAGIRMHTPYGLVSVTLAHFINLLPRSK